MIFLLVFVCLTFMGAKVQQNLQMSKKNALLSAFFSLEGALAASEVQNIAQHLPPNPQGLSVFPLE